MTDRLAPQAPAIKVLHRILLSALPAWVAVGWQLVALDWSPSVGDVALVEWGGSGHVEMPGVNDG